MEPNDSVPKETVQKIIEDLQKQENFPNIVSTAQRSVITLNTEPSQISEELIRLIKINGVETSLRNATVLRQRQFLKIEHEPLNYMKKAQHQFERKNIKSLLALRKELKENLIKQRTSIQMQEIVAKWDELSVYNFPDVGQIKMLYDHRDIYEAVISIRDPEHNLTGMEEIWGTIKVPLETSSLNDLVEMYADLVNDVHLGLGASLSSKTSGMSLLHYQSLLGEKVAAEKDILVCEEFIKRGCPPHLRPVLWKQALQSQSDFANFHALRQNVIKNELLLDRVVVKDIVNTAACDEHYFIFEDIVYQVLLCFSRDSHVNDELSQYYGSNATQSRFLNNQTQTENYPPSGVMHFGGCSMFAAPLCYLSDDSEEIYYLFRSLYLKYWHRLHRLSSHPESITSLCLLFERLLQQTEPQLWIHCLNYNIQPLKIATAWIVRAFSGYLLPEQLLFLWDIILGYNSLKVLPLLAAAIFSLRRENILRVESHSAVENILTCIKTIQVVPLLKTALKQSLK